MTKMCCGFEMRNAGSNRLFIRLRCHVCKTVYKRNKRLPNLNSKAQAEVKAEVVRTKASVGRLQAIKLALPYFREFSGAVKFVDSL